MIIVGAILVVYNPKCSTYNISSYSYSFRTKYIVCVALLSCRNLIWGSLLSHSHSSLSMRKLVALFCKMKCPWMCVPHVSPSCYPRYHFALSCDVRTNYCICTRRSVHLCNNSIQRHFENCPSRSESLPSHNMWDSSTFQQHLKYKKQQFCCQKKNFSIIKDIYFLVGRIEVRL